MNRIEQIDAMIADFEARIIALQAERAELVSLQEKANAYDYMNKIQQTEEGNGTIENPYKNWVVGMSVEEGCWYSTSDGYLWQAIKSGNPTSETDNEYFDVVGL